MDNANESLKKYVLLQHCPDGWKVSDEKSVNGKTALEYKFRKDKKRYVVINAIIEDGYLSFSVNKTVLTKSEAESMCGIIGRFAVAMSKYYRISSNS